MKKILEQGGDTMVRQATTIQGDCYVCGKTASKTVMKNHIIKEHSMGDEACYLVRAEGKYDKGYWLVFSIPFEATLSSLDRFLRQIWCECCGHMSSFSDRGGQVGKTRKLSYFDVGDKFAYEYDFGTTTELVLSIIDVVSRPKQSKKVFLLARNQPHEAPTCDHCDQRAVWVLGWEQEHYCDACASKSEAEFDMLPLVNSPRSGECAYTGAFDGWEFDPDALTPLKVTAMTAKPRKKATSGVKLIEVTPEARWNTLGIQKQTLLLANTFCGTCMVTTMRDYRIEHSPYGLILQGTCSTCGAKVARVVEEEWFEN